MASNPPGRCCTIGVTHTGEAKGEIKKIGNISTYFSYPESKQTSTAILICSDVIGHEFINAQLIADQFAANGYFVVMPDLFEGDPIPLNRPEGFNIITWLSKSGPEGKGHGTGQVDPIVEAVIKEMKGNLGVKKLGAVGYCFGAKYVTRFMAKGKGVDVGFVAHPSFVEADEIKGLTGPISIAAAETDQIFPAPKRRETEDILKDLPIPYQITLYSDVEHGFAVRADISKRSVKFAKEAAFVQAVSWFDEFLKGERSWAAYMYTSTQASKSPLATNICPCTEMDISDILASVSAPALPQRTLDLQGLTRAWVNERSGPELLPYPTDLIFRCTESVKQQIETIESMTGAMDPAVNFTLVILQTELERFKFLIRSFLRARIAKIDKYPLHYRLLATEDQGTERPVLSTLESQYLISHQALLSSHYSASFLSLFPPQLQKLDDTSGGISMIDKPDEDTTIFCRVLHDADVAGVLGDEIILKRGDIWVLRWSSVKDCVQRGAVELI